MYTCQILQKLYEDVVPQVSELHTAIQTDLVALRFLQMKRGGVHLTSVAERRLQWNTKYCNGISGHCK